MKKCYDWDKNKIELVTPDVEFDIQLKGVKNIVDGNSASGKTLLINKIKSINGASEDGLSPYDTSDIFIIDDSVTKLVYLNSEVRHKLVIVDRADIIMDDTIRNAIKYDDAGMNRYLLFGRTTLGIHISPNYYGGFVCNKKTITLKY